MKAFFTCFGQRKGQEKNSLGVASQAALPQQQNVDSCARHEQIQADAKLLHEDRQLRSPRGASWLASLLQVKVRMYAAEHTLSEHTGGSTG